MSTLADDMIRVTQSSIGENGRLVRDRPFHAFVSHHALKDARGRLRRFSSRSKAFRAAQAFITDHNQVTMSAALRASSDSSVTDACNTATKHKLIIEITYTGSVPGAHDAARRVLDDGTLQDAMHNYGDVSADKYRFFRITDVEIKAT